MRAAVCFSLCLCMSCGSQEPIPLVLQEQSSDSAHINQNHDRPTESRREIHRENPLLIREATISIEVEDYEDAALELTKLATSSQGFVLSREDQFDPSRDRRAGTVVLKVPGDRFDAVLEDVSSLALVVTSRQVSVEDVTEEVIDLDARLRVKRELEERFLSILEETESTSDALETEQALSTVREDIETLQGQLQLLERRVELSVITLELSEPEPLHSKLTEAWNVGTVICQYLLSAAIALTVGLSPLAVALILFILVVRFVMRRRRAQSLHMVSGEPL